MVKEWREENNKEEEVEWVKGEIKESGAGKQKKESQRER